MPRTVTLVLLDTDGEPLGVLAPFEAATPWWADVGPVVAAARQLHGIDVTVLRMLFGEHAPDGPSDRGGTVTYAAQLERNLVSKPSLRRVGDLVSAALEDHPLRLPWARPGGPQELIAWAAGHLPTWTGVAEQVKTWNLSAIWRLPLEDGTAAWLKCAPPFMAHEAAMIRLLGETHAPHLPVLIAGEPGRVLLAELPGEDQWEAAPETLDAFVDLFVGLQATWSGPAAVGRLLAAGCPDWRPDALVAAAPALVDQWRHALDDGAKEGIDRFVAGLADRFAAIDACGIPFSLVHGDAHTGNLRGPDPLVIFDWGDSGVGHPMLDVPAMRRTGLSWDHVVERWRQAVPGADVDRAATLMRPVAAFRAALMYQSFMDGIEPSERHYHVFDPPDCLAQAAE